MYMTVSWKKMYFISPVINIVFMFSAFKIEQSNNNTEIRKKTYKNQPTCPTMCTYLSILKEVASKHSKIS